MHAIHSVIDHITDKWCECELSYCMGIIFGMFVCMYFYVVCKIYIT
jgi:hypothetical protein